MIFGRKRIKELDTILTGLHMDASNNYKDAAQMSYQKFCKMLDQYIREGKLNQKQSIYYEEQKKFWEKELDHYTHKDQKVTW